MKYESCIFDRAEQHMTMKEKQNAAVYDSKSFTRETDPLTFGSKEVYELNDSGTDTSPLTYDAKGKDERWKPKVMDDFSMDNENGSIDTPRKEDQNGFSNHLNGWEKDADLLSSQTFNKDKEQRSPEHESLVTVEEFARCDGSESRYTCSPCNGASDLSKTEANLFTDKNVLECEMPELEVCYKEISYHIVKDICVDEGRPEDKSLIESCKDVEFRHLFVQPPNDSNRSEATEASSTDNANSLSANQRGSKEEDDDKLVAQGKLKSSSEDSVQTDEAYCGSSGKPATDSSEEVSFVDRELPIQDLGTQSSLRSLLTTLDAEKNKVTPSPDQTSDGKAASDCPAESSAEAGRPEEDVQPSSLLYNSKVETGTITFNFNSEHVEKESVDSGDVHDHKDADTDDLPDAEQLQCTSSSIENLHEQSLIIKGGDSDGSSSTSHVHRQLTEHKDANSNESSADGLGHANTSRSSTNEDEQAVEPNVLKHERKNSGNVSVVNQLQYDEGETSFSQAGLVTYSGPVAYSGSLSYRSDGSATSGRSFAFPILQSEWNSSPVRMAKADRKQKGWRSGLLCCRF